MDEVIFQEFKGTGNMELILDRTSPTAGSSPPSTSKPRPPAMKSSCARQQLQQVWKLRRVLSGLADGGGGGQAGLELLIDRLKTFKNNDEFLAEVAKGAVHLG